MKTNTFRCACLRNNINYSENNPYSHFVGDRYNKIILQNKAYIETNPDNLSMSKMANKLRN